MVNRKPTNGDDWGMVYFVKKTLPQFWGNDDNSRIWIKAMAGDDFHHFSQVAVKLL